MNYFNLFFSIFTTLYLYIITGFSFSKKGKRKVRWAFIVFFSLLFYFNRTYISSVFSLLFYVLFTFLFLNLNFYIYGKTLFFYGMVLYFLRFCIEGLFLITLYSLHIKVPTDLFFFSSILTLLFAWVFRSQIKSEMEKVSFFKSKGVLFKYIFINISALIILFLRLPRMGYKIETKSVLFIVIFDLTLLLLKEKEKTIHLIKQMKSAEEYSHFTEGLLFEYKSFVHEYKNKLIIIKGIANPKNRDLHKYIDNILAEKAVNHYRWLVELNPIPFLGIKSLINFKLLKMKEQNIDVEVYISKELSNLKENYLNKKEKNELNTILGILLDNAIEAGLESDEKMASFQIYKEKETIVILIANTFKSINIERFEEKGYSTKGKNRGLGLHIVKEILKENPIFSKETSILENYFVQKIKIQK